VLTYPIPDSHLGQLKQGQKNYPRTDEDI